MDIGVLIVLFQNLVTNPLFYPAILFDEYIMDTASRIFLSLNNRNETKISHYPPTEKVDPSKARAGIRPAMRLATFIGVCGGFLLAYQRSSCECRLPIQSK